MHYYTTMTEKGQITLPAAIRRKLKLEPGKKLSVTLGSDQHIIVESPPSLEEMQRKNREYLLSHGFTEKKLKEMAENFHNGDGWAAYVREKYGTPPKS